MGDRVSVGFRDTGFRTRVSGGTTGYSGIRGCTGVAFPGAQFFVQSGPKVVTEERVRAVAIVHRRVQLLVGHLDRSGLFGGGSTVLAWGGSGDRFRLHLVLACARTRSARDGRWPSFPWGVGEDVSQGTRESAQGECKQGERSRPSGRRPHEAEARPRRDRSRRGGQHCAVGRRHWGAVGGYCTAGEGRARKPRNTGRGEQS